MKQNHQPKSSGLSAGQLWRLKGRFVRIVALESLNVRFKFMNSDNEVEAKTLSGDVDTLGRYLLSRNGELVGALGA